LKTTERIFAVVTNAVYTVASVVLLGMSLTMIGYGVWEVWSAFAAGTRVIQTMLDAIGLIVVAVAVFDVAKYLMEEEVLRDRELRSAREARETLTKFLVIVSIAVSLEALVFIFGAGKRNMAELIYPTLLMAVAVFLVVGLGLYQRLSLSAERAAKRGS
jgi:hypothetical protein